MKATFTDSSSSDSDGIPIFFAMLTFYSVPLLAIYGIAIAVIERSIRQRATKDPTPMR